MPDASVRCSIPSVVLWLMMIAALIALYAGSFQTKPAGDDFNAPLAEIHRGQTEGPLALVRMSAQPHNYRPVQSLLMWAFGSISDVKDQQLIWIRILHLACMAAYAAVAVMWIKRLPMGNVGAIAASAMMVVHPVLPGAVGGIDGFAGPLAAAFMWSGALAVILLNHRLGLAVAIAVACFFAGGVTKEYSFGIGPLAVWAALVFSSKRRWINAFVIGFALAVSLALLMFVRNYTIPPGLDAGLSYITMSPANWIKNIALLTVATTFMGSTVWVMLREDTIAFAVAGAASCALMAVMLVGLWLQSSTARTASEGDSRSSIASPRCWIVYLIFAIPLAAVAPLLTERVSEMYAIGIIMPFALLFGLAIDGWWRQGGAFRTIATVSAATALTCAAFTTLSKVEYLRDVGDQADIKLRAILAALPVDVSNVTVALVYRQSEIAHQPRYSVFVIDDLIQTGQPIAMQWIAPERKIMLEPLLVDDWSAINLPQFDHVLLWRTNEQKYELQR